MSGLAWQPSRRFPKWISRKYALRGCYAFLHLVRIGLSSTGKIAGHRFPPLTLPNSQYPFCLLGTGLWPRIHQLKSLTLLLLLSGNLHAAHRLQLLQCIPMSNFCLWSINRATRVPDRCISSRGWKWLVPLLRDSLSLDLGHTCNSLGHPAKICCPEANNAQSPSMLS